jgi:hypothetical protein
MKTKRKHNYKGGSIASNGYKIIYVGKKHHLSDVRGYAYEHRIIAEKKIKRRLLPNEQVHHLDENKLNNNAENLEVVKSIKHHRFLHRIGNNKLKMPDEENILIKCICGCGLEFFKFDDSGREREYISGHNPRNKFLQNFIIREIKNGNNTTIGLVEKYGKTTIKTVMSKMVKEKLIFRVKKGKYSL